MSKDPKNPRGLSRKAIFRLFVTYWALFAMMATLVLFAVKSLLQPTGITIIAIASLVVPAIATWLHVRRDRKSGVDDIVRRMR